MRKVDLIVLKSFLGPFAVTFFVVEFVFIMQFFYVYIDDFIGKGLTWYVVAELVTYLSANTVPLALPLAILLSCIMAFGNLGERYELVALKTAGISMRRASMGLFIGVLLASAGSLAFSNYVVPTANLKFWTTLGDISRSKPALNIPEGVFYKEIEPYTLKIDRKDQDQTHIYGIVLHDYSDLGRPHNILVAERGEMYTTEDNKYLILKLFNGSKYETLRPDPEKRGVSRKLQTHFDEMEKVLDLSEFEFARSEDDLYKNQYQMFNIRQLKDYVDSLGRRTQKSVKQLRTELTLNYAFLRDSTFLASPGDGADFKRSLGLDRDFLSSTAARSIPIVKNSKERVDHARLQTQSDTDLTRRAGIELHRKYTSALACLVLFLIGAPFGVIVRKGGIGLPVIAAAILYVTFLILYKVGESMAKKGVFEPVVGMWLPPLIMLIPAIFLVYKANNDAALLQADQIKRVAKQLMIALRLKKP